MNDVKNITKNGNSLFLDSGSPHHLEFVEDVSKINVNDEGANIRYGKTYIDEGTNVDFIELIDEKKIKIRTYERGGERNIGLWNWCCCIWNRCTLFGFN